MQSARALCRELREEHYAGLQDRKYLSLAKAREARLSIDWKLPENAPVRPATLGNTVYRDYPLDQLLEAIDWNPFFQVRARRGRGLAPSTQRARVQA